MTLRELLQTLKDNKKLFRYLNKLDNKGRSKKILLKNTVMMYTHVMEELLKNSMTKKYCMPIIVSTSVGIDNEEFLDVSLLNKKYIEPPKDSKAWGGKNAPKGYYNIYLKKYNKYYSLMGIPWRKLIDTPIENPENLPLEILLGEILMELTFNGYTEKEVEKKESEIKESIKKSVQEIKKGKSIKITPKNKDEMSIVIPERLIEPLTEIFSNQK